EIAHDIGELYEPLAEEKGIALTVEAPAPVPLKCNRELVSQALANLVDNAIKYAGPVAALPVDPASEPSSVAGADSPPADPGDATSSTTSATQEVDAPAAAGIDDALPQQPHIAVRAEISGRR